MLQPRSLGRLGESIAALVLMRKGFIILARNWRTDGGELDLVARRREKLVVVEVKTRRGDAWVAPELAVDGEKQVRLRRAARAFLATHMLGGWRSVRFDIVAVTLDRRDRVVDVRHFADAF